MLKEYKDIYIHAVEAIPGWKKMSQIELANKYLEGGKYKDSYLAAIVLRYWNIIERMIYKDKGLYDEVEAYDWFMDALLYTLSECPWKDPQSSVYNDPRAIEKILNTCASCSRANWFQASNRQKRKINHGIGSLDAIKEEYSDSFMSEELITEINISSYKDLVLYYYNKKQYLLALIIDVIVNDVRLEGVSNDKLLISNIKKSIKSLPSDYYLLFANTYNLDSKQVEKSFNYIYNMSDNKLRQSIETYIYKLRTVLRSEF